MKRVTALALALIMLLSLCACGGRDDSVFRTLEVVDSRDYTLICRSGDALADVVGAGMKVLAANGYLASACWQWLNKNLIILEGSPDALAPYAETLQPRTLIVGVDTGFNPLSFEENGELRGLFVDIANSLGAVLGWEIRLQPISRNELAAQLSSGNIDCALGFDSRLVSEDKYSVGEPFLHSDVVLAVRSDSAVKKLSQLGGHRIGTVEDAAIKKLVERDEKIMKYSCGTTTYVNARQCVNALEKGWCSAVALDSIMLAYYMYN